MKKTFFWIISLFGFLWLFGSVLGQTEIDPMHMPVLTEYVEDFSYVLSDVHINTLRKTAYEYFSGTSTQIATVLFPYRQGNELADIGVNYFNDNKIGQKDSDNGLLLLIATEEKKIRIVVGYGLEWAIPDLVSRQIVDAIRPYINEGKYYEAITLFYDMSMSIIADAGDVFGEKNTGDTQIVWWIWARVINMLLVFCAILYGFYLPFYNKRSIPERVKKFFGGEKKNTGKMFLWIVVSYIIIGCIFFSLKGFLESIPFVASAVTWFFSAFLVWFLLALSPWKWPTWWNTHWSKNKQLDSSSTYFDASAKNSFSAGGGRTWWGWAGD